MAIVTKRCERTVLIVAIICLSFARQDYDNHQTQCQTRRITTGKIEDCEIVMIRGSLLDYKSTLAVPLMSFLCSEMAFVHMVSISEVNPCSINL